ncbi:polymerase, partial [Mycobacterium sp. ITM-2017-0098]
MTGATRVGQGEVAALVVAVGVVALGALFVFGTKSTLLLIGALAIFVVARRQLVAVSIMVAIEFSNLSALLAPRTGLPVFP